MTQAVVVLEDASRRITCCPKCGLFAKDSIPLRLLGARRDDGQKAQRRPTDPSPTSTFGPFSEATGSVTRTCTTPATTAYVHGA